MSMKDVLSGNGELATVLPVSYGTSCHEERNSELATVLPVSYGTSCHEDRNSELASVLPVMKTGTVS